jgi:uncharacterized RDD family membrane protein YckC
MLTRMAVTTPEAVSVSVPLAGLGSRFAAGLVDLSAQGLLMWLTVALAGAMGDTSEGLARAFLAVIFFLILFFYPVLFEVLWGGKTPGKRLNGLRVVTTLGGPVTLRASVIRNLVRLIDFLPAFYAIGMFALLAGITHQRLGDVAAGTVVTFEPKRTKKSTERVVDSVRLPDPALLTSVDVSRVSSAEIAAVRQFLDRRGELPFASRATLARRFAQPLRSKVFGIPTNLHDEHFLEALSQIKGQRS